MGLDDVGMNHRYSGGSSMLRCGGRGNGTEGKHTWCFSVGIFLGQITVKIGMFVFCFLKSLKRTSSMIDSYYIYGKGPNNPPTAFAFGPKDLAAKLYQHSPNEDLALATTLVRPIYLYSAENLSRELVLSTEIYGSVSRVFLIADDDRNVGKDFQKWMIEKNPPTEVYEIEGSDHMVMISKPVELLFRLLYIAERYS